MSGNFCEGYGDQVAYCYNPAYDTAAEIFCVDYLTYLSMIYGPTCTIAFEDFIVCLNNFPAPISTLEGWAAKPKKWYLIKLACLLLPQIRVDHP